MPEPKSPPPRYRERVQALRSFSASETGCTGRNAERDPLWIDRVRFHVPTIGIRRTAGDLYPYLQERKEVGPFRYGRTPAGLHTIEFGPSQWLFSAKLSFWPVRATSGGTRRRAQATVHPYRGHAEITLNPTRLFAHMAPEVVANAVPALHSYDLRSWSDRTEVLRGRTLDGSDNVIPDDLIQAAIALDWPRFCQDCAHRIAACMSIAIGTSYEVGAEGESGLDRFEPLLALPSPEAWSLQQVEHYHEYTTDNAIEAIRRVEPYALSLSREVGVRTYERHVRTEAVRQDNARTLSMGLERKGAYLVLYAKTLERVRVEVRFQQEPAAIAGLRSNEYAGSPNGMANLLRGTSADAARRLAQWVSEFHESIPRGRPTHKLVTLIAKLSTVCGTGPLLTKVLAILLAHGGIIRTGHTDIDPLIPQMIKHGLIVRVRSGRARNVVHYRLRRDYAAIVRSIRALEEVDPAMGAQRFPP